MISMLLTWLEIARRKYFTPEPAGESIQKIVHDNFLGKRQNSRVSYSHIGAVGDLPRIYFQNDEMNVGNISVGGVLIVDDGNRLGTTVGEMIVLEFRFKDVAFKVKSRVVGANLQRRHIQFSETPTVLRSRLDRAVLQGHPGTKFHRVQLSAANVKANEIWMDAAGSSLVFHSLDTGSWRAEFAYNSRVMEFDANQAPRLKNKGPNGQETFREMTLSETAEVLLVLANIKDPSPSVRHLVERLHHFHERPARARAG